MNARRRRLASLSAVGALLALAACEKPAPIVTLVSGGSSVYTETRTYCFEGQTPPDCSTRSNGSTELQVRAGETVGVDVDRELAEAGWFLELEALEGQEQGQRSEVQRGHYFTFTAPNLTGTSAKLAVRSLGEGEEPTGEWSFTLTPKR